MGRAPKAREGIPAVMAGVPICPGVAPSERTFSLRASLDDLWAPLTVAATPSGREAIWKLVHKTNPDGAALRRFSAYVAQGRSFYTAARDMDVLSRPLAGYYAVLNLAKAWLTIVDPSVTGTKLLHGAKDSFVKKQRYWFSQEELTIQKQGVLREVAARTGSGFAYKTSHQVRLAELAPYLCEAYDEYEQSSDQAPKLLPLTGLTVMRGSVPSDSGGSAGALWLRAEVAPGALQARNLAASTLTARAAHFGKVFQRVETAGETYSYESAPVVYGRNTTYAVPGIADQFGSSLIHVDRSAGRARFYLVLSSRGDLLSQEAVSFAVIHHLSNMVRYRPEEVERLAGEKWSWLLSTWVPRAIESALLTYSSRIIRQEFRVG